MTFAELGLSKKALSALEKAGFEAPTPIQAQAIPHALAGKDVIGVGRHRHRQDAGFLLPILERLFGSAKPGTRALILAPTRELAAADRGRAGEVPQRLRHLRSAVVIGGVGMGPQIEALRRRAPRSSSPRRAGWWTTSIRKHARLDGIEVLVLDEADRMLDMGFLPQLTRILAQLPAARQTLLFSATIAGEVADFARAHLRDPVQIEVARSGTTVPGADPARVPIGQEEKLPLLARAAREDAALDAGLHADEAPRGSGLKDVQRAGHKVASHPRRPLPGTAAAGAGGFKAASTGCWLRPTSRRAAST